MLLLFKRIIFTYPFFRYFETPNIILALNVPQDVLLLGVSTQSPGLHLVKIDSTAEITIAKAAGTTYTYNIEYRLQEDGVNIAVLQESGSGISNCVDYKQV
ncbi:hypothetical protein QUF79_23505 [Fictibacillus enclensis]|uniref:hypothetical protein n=1 Tax=Fictibacillus enclensis TaxID=1017270 RepID=UPI0025A267CB|nr:hypothetical protein [Fictibacillus enclensis]MDM5200995.1 hypothetical protein [Fictibacillus enclensis]